MQANRTDNNHALESTKLADGYRIGRPVSPDTCDSHIHIFDQRFPGRLARDIPCPTNAAAKDYIQVQQDTGLGRVVIVTPRIYDTDNRITVDAIRRLGRTRARGVAVLHPDVSDTELETLNAAGICGVRFTLYSPINGPTRLDMIEPLADRVQDLGWHVQLHFTADQIANHEALLARLSVTLVIDHLGRVPPRDGLRHPACRTIERLLTNGRTWIKLSAPYLDSAVGAKECNSDLDAVARHWIGIAPERLVWGSDWPHTSVSLKPDVAALLSKLNSWADDPVMWNRILITNPMHLYGFG